MELLSVEYLLAAFLIFVRVSSMIMTAPYFSSASFPARVKLFFALITSMLLFSVIPAENVAIPPDAGAIYLATTIIIEVLTGVAMGLTGQLIFAGLELAGRLISLKIVLGFASVVDTMTQQQSTIVSNLFSMLAVLVFLSIDGDKVYITALAKSFEVIPLSQANVQLAGPYMLDIAVYMFLIAVQIMSPFFVVMFLLDLALAIFARIMPQANIMFIALPIKLGVGFIMLILISPYLPIAFRMMLQRLFNFLLEFMEVLSPI
ncbi:MAG TPA: flagellar biosynthetic protein FliR [Bacteroidales bacterium]|nr:flagellar biosynthetic protein FliR [Bacteroidales bacterium]